VNPTTAVGLGFLVLVWLFLIYLTFRPPDTPKVSRLFFFLLLLATSGALGYFFLIRVYGLNPNPIRVDLARNLTDDRMIYLGDIVPGLFDLDYIHRVDTDARQEEEKTEWLAFYQYDVKENPEGTAGVGPFGAAIYDYDDCRPPALLSYELIPVNYNYLGQDYARVEVANIIAYDDPLSASQDRPEVIIYGYSRGVVTDLNIFRKVGVELSCLQRQQWLAAHPGEAFPNPVRYANIGSFRGTYQVTLSGSTVTVANSAGFERSQFVARQQYRPEPNGTYFKDGKQLLPGPAESSLAFGPGEPTDITRVYYPEKAVLAFYLDLGQDQQQLRQAESYLSPAAQANYDIDRDPFGLSTASDSVARARDRLARVLVLELRYEPDVQAEQLHEDRQVTATVVGVSSQGEIDSGHQCQVTWVVIGFPEAGALPYDCEWRLDRYQSTCSGP
jgi:hypothetical protein